MNKQDVDNKKLWVTKSTLKFKLGSKQTHRAGPAWPAGMFMTILWKHPAKEKIMRLNNVLFQLRTYIIQH